MLLSKSQIFRLFESCMHKVVTDIKQKNVSGLWWVGIYS